MENFWGNLAVFFRKSAYIRISHDRKSRRFYGNNVFKYTLIIAFLTYMRFTVYRSSRASGAQDTSTLTRCGQVDTLQLLCFYRAILCIRGTSHGPVSVSVSVCPPQVGVLSKRLSESSCFWHMSFLPPVLHCVKRKFGYLRK